MRAAAGRGWTLAVVGAVWAVAVRGAPDTEVDVAVYGGTSAAVTAAVQAATMGARVVIVSPDRHLGGLSSGGLGYTDSGNTQAIGGLAREFYRRVHRHYADESAWGWQPRAAFRGRGQGVGREEDGQQTMWLFEPHVAERIFDEWVAEAGLTVVREALLDRESGVTIERLPGGPRITAITTLPAAGMPARRFRAQVFIDATYEGDLMAAAGVAYHVGRESNATYGEQYNGNQVGVLHHGHHFKDVAVDPYRVPGDPASGLLPRISADPPGVRGEGDHRVQAYCFRMCLTNVPANRVPFPQPEGYDASQYQLLARTFAAGLNDDVFKKFDAIPNGKTDTNNHGPFSTDNIGMNYDYPEASYARRREIIREHETYQQGLMWFLCHDDRVPEAIRTEMNTWGLARDEFTDNGHWPHQLYIREARRMVGEDVMTEHHVLSRQPVSRPVGMGSYTLDSHNVRRYVIPAADGTPARVQNEGDIGVHVPKPYSIGYGCLVPKRDQCTNLLVPVCVSASHIAYGSIRMEPVFMLLGQSAATAAVMAARDGVAVQNVPYDRLRERLLADGQRLEAAAR
ncbi:MAG: FAD-dependent oxidoreductase [Planctomycetia bacterium]